MIGKLKGTIAEYEGNRALIETPSGVFYTLFVTPEIVKAYNAGDKAEIYTYLSVKEDSLTLFGFEDKKKFHLFSQLLSVDGVGPKSAFGIVSFAPSDKLVEAIVSQSLSFFNSIPGIGKKTAQKILLELAGKFNTEFELKSTVLSADDKMFLDALSSLGFEKEVSQKALNEVDSTLSIEKRISDAIKLITARK